VRKGRCELVVVRRAIAPSRAPVIGVWVDSMDRVAWSRMRRAPEAMAAVVSVLEEHDVYECACLRRALGLGSLWKDALAMKRIFW